MTSHAASARGLVAAFGSTFFELVGFFMLMPLLQLTLATRGISASGIGMFTALEWAGVFVVTPLAGRLARALGEIALEATTAHKAPVIPVGRDQDAMPRLAVRRAQRVVHGGEDQRLPVGSPGVEGLQDLSSAHGSNMPTGKAGEYASCAPCLHVASTTARPDTLPTSCHDPAGISAEPDPPGQSRVDMSSAALCGGRQPRCFSPSR